MSDDQREIPPSPATFSGPEEAEWFWVPEDHRWKVRDIEGNLVSPFDVPEDMLEADKTYTGIYPANFDKFTGNGGVTPMGNRFAQADIDDDVAPSEAQQRVIAHNLASLTDVAREDYKRTFGVYPGE